MAGPVTTFYAHGDTVLRLVRSDAAVDLAVWRHDLGKWIDAPGQYGYVTGIGGDPPDDEISRDQARAIIDRGATR